MATNSQRDSYGVPRSKRDLEREAAMLESLRKIRREAQRYARLHQEAHPDATVAQCFRPAIFAALRAAEPEHNFWEIVRERARRVRAALARVAQ